MRLLCWCQLYVAIFSFCWPVAPSEGCPFLQKKIADRQQQQQQQQQRPFSKDAVIEQTTVEYRTASEQDDELSVPGSKHQVGSTYNRPDTTCAPSQFLFVASTVAPLFGLVCVQKSDHRPVGGGEGNFTQQREQISIGSTQARFSFFTYGACYYTCRRHFELVSEENLRRNMRFRVY